MTPRSWLALVGLLAVTLTGCTPSVDDSALVPEDVTSEHLLWLQERIDPDTPSADETVEARLADEFAATLDPGMLEARLAQLAHFGPWSLTDVDARGLVLRARLTAATGHGLAVELAIDQDGDITGLVLDPAVPEFTVEGLQDAVEVAATIAPGAMVAAHRIDDQGTCVEVAGSNTTSAAPVASLAKLYVVAAVDQAVAAGRIAWDDLVTVGARDRSIPGGPVHDQPGGTATVSELAKAAIASSDNTATDHLVTLVGREAVEAIAAASGHHAVDLVTPFLRTREVVQLGWDPALRDVDFTTMPEADRRMVAEGLPPGTGGVEAADMLDPAWERGIDWFASTTDICRVWSVLAASGSDELRAVLAADDDALGTERLRDPAWSYVATKNGVAPGVYAATWLLERGDGARFVVTIGQHGEAVDGLRLLGIAHAMMPHLAEHPGDSVRMQSGQSDEGDRRS